jgi:hypothetical protein
MGKSKLKRCANVSLVKSVESRKEQNSSFIEFFNFDVLVKKLRQLVQILPDNRTGNNINKSITKENVIQIVPDGRACWKIENENNNVFKTKGTILDI